MIKWLTMCKGSNEARVSPQVAPMTGECCSICHLWNNLSLQSDRPALDGGREILHSWCCILKKQTGVGPRDVKEPFDRLSNIQGQGVSWTDVNARDTQGGGSN